jgi:deazaflavin-dependent oxidoreductase (nitroreductase family)
MKKRVLQLVMTLHTLIYRLSGGRLLNVAERIILLSTLGRRSGMLRTAPLFSIRDSEAYVVIGSYGGSDAHPAWYYNLQTRPYALLYDRNRQLAVNAIFVSGAEYERLWALLVAANPTYAEYRKRTTRRLPIVRLEERRV